MKKPPWLTAEAAKHGQRLLDGASTRAEALAEFTARIEAHPEHVAALITACAEKELGAWLRANAPAEEAAAALVQLPLFPEFPGLPAQMRVTPTKSERIDSMTAHQLDAAKNILWARTQNQMDGVVAATTRERDEFTRFYDRVRPMLRGEMTVAEALGRPAVVV